MKIDYSGISRQVGESPYKRGKDLLQFRHNPFFSPVWFTTFAVEKTERNNKKLNHQKRYEYEEDLDHGDDDDDSQNFYRLKIHNKLLYNTLYLHIYMSISMY